MKKNSLAKRLAKKSHVSTAEAADTIDALVSQILSELKAGQSVCLPGVGEFKQAAKPKTAKKKINAK